MEYKVGDRIEVETLDDLDAIIDAGYGWTWSAICVVEITSVPDKEAKNE